MRECVPVKEKRDTYVHVREEVNNERANVNL
jgi:hypothetical protein